MKKIWIRTTWLEIEAHEVPLPIARAAIRSWVFLTILSIVGGIGLRLWVG